MILIKNGEFPRTWNMLRSDLRQAAYHPVEVGEWQSRTVHHELQKFIEVQDVVIQLDIPPTIDLAQEIIKPNLPWAEDHFQERVSGEPLNPPPSHAWWPFAQAKNEEFTNNEKFSHTYPERMWPKRVGIHRDLPMVGPNHGLRFELGDLNDVVDLMKRSRWTRQAYLPIWFPEDTGNAMVERVPCTLGYHFMIRDGHMNCSYYIRSCDFIRHFNDDVYMAMRLTQWLCYQLDCMPGSLNMYIASLHCFLGDKAKLNKMRYEDAPE